MNDLTRTIPAPQHEIFLTQSQWMTSVLRRNFSWTLPKSGVWRWDWFLIVQRLLFEQKGVAVGWIISQNVWGWILSSLQTRVSCWDYPSHFAHSSIAISYLTLYLTIFLVTLRVKAGSLTMRWGGKCCIHCKCNNNNDNFKNTQFNIWKLNFKSLMSKRLKNSLWNFPLSLNSAWLEEC